MTLNLVKENQSDLPPDVEVVPVRFRIFDTENFVTGHAAKRGDGFVLLMLDVLDKNTSVLEMVGFLDGKKNEVES